MRSALRGMLFSARFKGDTAEIGDAGVFALGAAAVGGVTMPVAKAIHR